MFGHDNNNNDQSQDHNDGISPPMTAAPPPDNYFHHDEPGSASLTPTDDSTTDHSDDFSSGPPAAPDSSVDDLLSIKQEALQQLSPLVGHLDQTPEERFRTTMMMIQGSDDQSLIKDAYAAAKEITDEKSRAQALLDIVNEINYFTQHNAS